VTELGTGTALLITVVLVLMSLCTIGFSVEYYGADSVVSGSSDSGDAYATAYDNDYDEADLYVEAYDGNGNAYCTWRKDFSVSPTTYYDISFKFWYDGIISKEQQSDVALLTAYWKLVDDTNDTTLFLENSWQKGVGSYTDMWVLQLLPGYRLDSTHDYYWEFYARAAGYSDNGEAISDFEGGSGDRVDWAYLTIVQS